MPKQPLAEVFGFPIDNLMSEAQAARSHCLCPFNNKVARCTKSNAKHPLGVCSVFDDREIVITCPIRFRQDWIIATDAAGFFFPPKTKWSILTEVRLKDRDGKSAGNLDVVLVSQDERGKITDFGALEIQAVYISGNVSNPFKHYMAAPNQRKSMNWQGKPNYPHPDYLSSSRKRLAPQLIFKGGILKAWNKKIAVALNRGFFETLPSLEHVKPGEADIGWFVYDLEHDKKQNLYRLVRHKAVYTKFDESLDKITRSQHGDVQGFMEHLQGKCANRTEEQKRSDELF